MTSSMITFIPSHVSSAVGKSSLGFIWNANEAANEEAITEAIDHSVLLSNERHK